MKKIFTRYTDNNAKWSPVQRSLSIVVFMSATLMSASAVAADKADKLAGAWYASGTIGPAWLDDGDGDFAISGAIGKRFTSPFRGELNVSYQEADNNKGDDTYALGLFANGYYDFSIDSNLTPFIGLGLGPVFTGRDGAGKKKNRDDEDTDLGFNFIAGGSYLFSETLDIVGQYRYLNTSGFVDEVHALEVGLRFNF